MKVTNEIIEFDKLRSKVLKYIVYKKRTEIEVRQKFKDIDESILEKIIDDMKALEYIDDDVYIDKAVKEFMRLKNMSLKEVRYKLITKGLGSTLIENYIDKNIDELKEFELQSAKNIVLKKCKTEECPTEMIGEVVGYLGRKGYTSDTIRNAVG